MITGGGKTYGNFEYLFPDLFSRGVKLIPYVVPQQGLISASQVEEIAILNEFWAPFNIVILDGTNEEDKKDRIWPDFIQSELDKGKVVIPLLTDALLNHRRKELRPLFLAQGRKLGLVRDEIHWAGHSDADWAREANGVYNPEYQARTIKFMDEVVEVTPYVFTYTATATLEQQQCDSKRFVMVNEWVPPSKFVTCTKHFNEKTNWIPYRDFDKQMRHLKNRIQIMDILRFDAEEKISARIEELKNDYDMISPKFLRKINFKFTMLVRAEQKGDTTSTSDMVLQDLIQAGGLPRDLKIVTVNSKDGWDAYDNKGNQLEGSKNDNGWLDYVNSPDNKFVVLIVINMGTMGVNIPSLVECFSLRSSEVATSDKELILKNNLQFMGRFSRLWLGGLTENDLLQLDPETQVLIWETFNVCNRTFPDTDPNKEAVEEFNNRYAVLTSDLVSHMTDVHPDNSRSDDGDSLEDDISTLLDLSDVIDNDFFGSNGRTKSNEETYFDQLKEDNDLLEKKLRIEKVLENA